MTTYKTGKVYRIIHLHSDIQYVGSTMCNRLWDRWSQHVSSYSYWRKGGSSNKKKVSIYPYFEEYGIENFKIILIEKYQVCDKKHIGAYEQLWINKLNCVNKQNVIKMLPKHYDKIYNKNYRKNNRNKLKVKNKEWRLKNRITLLQKKKQDWENKREEYCMKKREHYKKNKIEILQKQKKYNEKNREKIRTRKKQKIKCECGSVITKASMSRHKRTQKHQKFLFTKALEATPQAGL